MKLNVEYAERHILPSDLFDGLGTKWDGRALLFNETFETADGVKCRVSLRGTMNVNDNARQRRELDLKCKKMYGKDFNFVESVWLQRLRRLSGYWNVITMQRI